MLENTIEMGYTPVREDVYQTLYNDEEFNWDDLGIFYDMSSRC